jgi:hypothetical protein
MYTYLNLKMFFKIKEKILLAEKRLVVDGKSY